MFRQVIGRQVTFIEHNRGWSLRQFSRRSVVQLSKERGVTLQQHLAKWGLKHLLVTWWDVIDLSVKHSITRASQAVKRNTWEYMPWYPEDATVWWDYESEPIPWYLKKMGSECPARTVVHALSFMRRVSSCGDLSLFSYAKERSYGYHRQYLMDAGVKVFLVGKEKDAADLNIRRHMFLLAAAGILPDTVGVISNDTYFAGDLRVMSRIYGYKVSLVWRYDKSTYTDKSPNGLGKRRLTEKLWEEAATVDEFHALVARALVEEGYPAPLVAEALTYHTR